MTQLRCERGLDEDKMNEMKAGRYVQAMSTSHAKIALAAMTLD